MPQDKAFSLTYGGAQDHPAWVAGFENYHRLAGSASTRGKKNSDFQICDTQENAQHFSDIT